MQKNYYFGFFLTVLLAACGEKTPEPNPIGVFEFANANNCDAPATGHAAGSEETPFFSPKDNQVQSSLAPVLGNALAREHQSLNGEWQYIIDQANIGDNSPLLRGGVGENIKHGVHELLEYSFEGGDTLTVPGDWNTQVPEMFWYRGVVWMQRIFDVAKVEGKRYWLYFGGANFKKDIYVNGKLLARHRGGFTPFNLDVTDHLHQGENNVVVKVDSISGPDQVPTEYNDWFNYGGITREVRLLELPGTFVHNYKVQLAKNSTEELAAWVRLAGEGASGASVSISIPELNVELAAETNASGLAQFSTKIRPDLWSPKNPKLYKVVIASGSDRVQESIGFRSISVQGESILLNGESVYLRGISMHEESITNQGRAWGKADAERAIAEIKALNANYVRLAHYPHNEYLVRAAERAGLMVWAELPVYHSIDFTNPCTLASAKQQYSEFIARDQNRAAVIFWSLANETQNTPPRNAFLAELAAHVRSLDNTRLLTAAVLAYEGMRDFGEIIGKKLAAKHSKVAALMPDPKPATVVIDDPLSEIVDVLGYNEYLGWYTEGPMAQSMKEAAIPVDEAEVREMMLRELPNLGTISTRNQMPIVISEFGGGAKQGFRSAENAPFSEDYQAALYRKQLAFLAKSPAIRGMSPWVLKDFRAPYRLHTRYQDYWNRKGLISEQGERKQAFNVLSDHYASLKESGGGQ